MREGQSRITAVINAGGRSQRMAASGIALHKALIPVLGVPLVERNLCVLLDLGYRDIVVVVSASQSDLEAFVQSRLVPIAVSSGAVIECIREIEPLGNVGILSRLALRASDILVTFADNLTTLDLREVVARHRTTSAALTVATHFEDFRIPHGELRVTDGVVVDYLEKPTRRLHVASGVYVVYPRAAALVPAETATGAVDLFRTLKNGGERISAFEHDAPWIDVNDQPALRRAEELVATHADFFEIRARAPDATNPCVLFRTATRTLAKDQRNGGGSFDGRWDVARFDRADLVERMVRELVGSSVAKARLASFDDLADNGLGIVRHDVEVIDFVDGAQPGAPNGYEWIASEGPFGPMDLTQPLRRCLALAKRSR